MRVAFVAPEMNIRFFNALGTYPLGVLYNATTLKKEHPEYDVRVFNEDYAEVFRNGEIIQPFLLEADVVGFSTLTATAPRVYDAVDRLRDLKARGKTNRNQRIIIGGMHATVLPDEAIQHADVVVKGEGERIIVPAVNGELEGIVQGERIGNLDDLVEPDLRLMKIRRKWTELISGNMASISSSRGCCYKCDFCSVHPVFGPTRIESPEKTFQKIKNLYKMGYGRFFFHDDNFSWNKRERLALADMLIKSRLGIRYFVQDRIDLLQDEDYVERLARSGCTLVMFSVESATKEFMEQHHKQLDLGKVKTGCDLLRKYGIKGYAFCMVDYENPEVTERTLEVLRENKIKYAQFTIPTPLPGSELYDKMKDRVRYGWENFHCLTAVTEEKEKMLEAARHLADTWRKYYSYPRIASEFMKNWKDGLIGLYGRSIARKIMEIQPSG